MDPYGIMMGLILVLTPIICWFFTLHDKKMRTPVRQWGDVIHNQRYYLHAMGYLVIIRWKSITDKLNEPIKLQTGHWTAWIHSIEYTFLESTVRAIISSLFLKLTILLSCAAFL